MCLRPITYLCIRDQRRLWPSLRFIRVRILPQGSAGGHDVRPDKEQSKVFTDLFDATYFHLPKDTSMNNRFLSLVMAGGIKKKIASFLLDIMVEVVCVGYLS